MTNAEYRQPGSALLRPLSQDDAIDFERVAEVVHYVIAKTAPGKLGHVKLNRILWQADLEHYRWHGESLTSLRQYTRMPQGPISQEISRAVGRLARRGKVAERTVEAGDFPRREMVALQEPDLDAFTDQRIAILDEMIKIIAPLTAIHLSELTHGDPAWEEVSNGDAMSIATGSVIARPLRSK